MLSLIALWWGGVVCLFFSNQVIHFAASYCPGFWIRKCASLFPTALSFWVRRPALLPCLAVNFLIDWGSVLLPCIALFFLDQEVLLPCMFFCFFIAESVLWPLIPMSFWMWGSVLLSHISVSIGLGGLFCCSVLMCLFGSEVYNTGFGVTRLECDSRVTLVSYCSHCQQINRCLRFLPGCHMTAWRAHDEISVPQ